MKTENKVKQIRKTWMISCNREWKDLKDARTNEDIIFMRITS